MPALLLTTSIVLIVTIYCEQTVTGSVVAMSSSPCVNRGRACIVDYFEYYMSA